MASGRQDKITLEDLFLAAERAGLRLSVSAGKKEFRAGFRRCRDPLAALPALKALEAVFGDDYFFAVEDAPACLLPESYWRFSPCAGPAARVRACADCRLRGPCRGVPASGPWLGLPEGALRPVLPAPAEVVLELNKNCNLSCRACFGRKEESLPFSAVRRTMSQARALGVQALRLTGGEPLLYPRFWEALELARKNGFYVIVNTNATLLGERAARRLARLAHNVLVSLPGPSAPEHDAASGRPGLFTAKAGSLRAMKKAGLRPLRAGTVISSGLASRFPAGLKKVRALGFDSWELYRPMLGAEALAAAPEYRAGLREVRALATALAGQKGRPRVTIANPVPFCALPARARPWALGARFDDGWSRLVLDSSGVYKPSYPSRLRLGRGLAGAWRSPALRRLTSGRRFPAPCRGCLALFSCLGGSAFHARVQNGAIADPWARKRIK